jgi:hypothetical protein
MFSRSVTELAMTGTSYTLGEAAKATGMSKSSILRAIKGHKVSATKDEANGVWLIEPAELHRLYPRVSEEQSEPKSEASGNIRELQVRLEAAQQTVERLDGIIADLRDDRDRWRTQAEKLLLTDQRAIITPPPVQVASPPPPATAEKPRRWWHRRSA